LFKLPASPSPRADPHELADFAELICWDRGSASKREIVSYLGQIDDNENNRGCDDDDDENSDLLDEAMNEIDRRLTACGGGYPFTLDLNGTVLRTAEAMSKTKSVVYQYLLLSTRLNMKNQSVQAGIDGTQLLEEVAAVALKTYLGSTRARALVFGTAAAGTFKRKVDHLCRELREGTGFEGLDKGRVRAKDDKLDAVAWVPFSDLLPGQLIVFAQCKTGTEWDTAVQQLQPDAFVKKWMRGTILVNPARAFCISEAADRSHWNEVTTSAGILFDRCRLVDFSEDIPPKLEKRLEHWTASAKAKVTYA
jgi:hypothetical protein